MVCVYMCVCVCVFGLCVCVCVYRTAVVVHGELRSVQEILLQYGLQTLVQPIRRIKHGHDH